MIVRAWIGPADPNARPVVPAREVQAEADTYAEATALIDNLIDPAREQILNYR